MSHCPYQDVWNNAKLHYFRNKLNRAPTTLNELMLEADKWILCDIEDSLFHMNGKDGFYNVKFISTCGKYEAVYNKAGELLTEDNDAVNMGTYNYVSAESNSGGHGLYDVWPYTFLGNSPKALFMHMVNKDVVISDNEAMRNRDKIVAEFEKNHT